MAELIEDCLDVIFGYLSPVEWIRIAQVCPFWKSVVRNQWKKITDITYDNCYDEVYLLEGERIPRIISAKDAQDMVPYAAEFCNILRSILWRGTKKFVIHFGPFFFKVEHCNIDNIMQLWAKNATKLTQLLFCEQPKLETLQLLLKSNNISSISLGRGHDYFWRDIRTSGIDFLDVDFHDADDDFLSFEGHFPDLKELSVIFKWSYPVEDFTVQTILSRTLPYVLGITSLTLYLQFENLPNINLKELVRFPHLEKLSLQVYYRNRNNTEHAKFDENLDVFCPKLQDVTLIKVYATDSALRSLFSLTNLEKLHLMIYKPSFGSMEQLPELEKLTECFIEFSDMSSTLSLTGLCNAVKKMPNLESFIISGLPKEQMFMFYYQAIVAATSRDKNVVLTLVSVREGFRHLKIESKMNRQDTVMITDRNAADLNKMCNDIRAFVEQHLKDYRILLR